MNALGRKISGSTKTAASMWAALALAMFLGLVWNLSLPDAAGRLRSLPENGLFYTSQSIALSPEELKFFGAATVQRRQVALNGSEFVLTIIDGTRNRHAVHDPLYCFRSAGYHIDGDTVVPLRQGNGHSVYIRNPAGTATVLFWFSDGTVRHASSWRYWWQATCRRITRGSSSPEPILVILTMPGEVLSWPKILSRCPELMKL